jgi:hypothetical protein
LSIFMRTGHAMVGAERVATKGSYIGWTEAAVRSSKMVSSSRRRFGHPVLLESRAVARARRPLERVD